MDFIHKKYVSGEMRSACGSVEFSGKLDRLLIFPSFRHNFPYIKKNVVRHIRVKKDVPCQRFFKVPHLFETIEM